MRARESTGVNLSESRMREICTSGSARARPAARPRHGTAKKHDELAPFQPIELHQMIPHEPGALGRISDWARISQRLSNAPRSIPYKDKPYGRLAVAPAESGFVTALTGRSFNGTAHHLGIAELIGAMPKGLDKFALI